MMKTGLFRFLCPLIGLFLCTLVSIAGEQDELHILLNKVNLARSGKTKSSILKATSWTTTARYTNYPEMGQVVYKFYAQWPDIFREQDLHTTTVFNGRKGWISQRWMGIRDLKSEEIITESFKVNCICQFLPFGDKSLKLKSLGFLEINTSKYFGIQVESKDLPLLQLYFANEDGLLAKCKYRTNPTKNDVELDYSEYKVVHGLKIPHKIMCKINEKHASDLQISDIKLFNKLDSALIVKPSYTISP
jgi:hypothetical protein